MLELRVAVVAQDKGGAARLVGRGVDEEVEVREAERIEADVTGQAGEVARAHLGGGPDTGIQAVGLFGRRGHGREERECGVRGSNEERHECECWCCALDICAGWETQQTRT